jgi:hypothetical protein
VENSTKAEEIQFLDSEKDCKRLRIRNKDITKEMFSLNDETRHRGDWFEHV